MGAAYLPSFTISVYTSLRHFPMMLVYLLLSFVAHSSHHSFLHNSSCKMSSRPWGVLNAIEGNCKQTYSSVSIKECWLQFRGNCLTSSTPDRGFNYLQTRHRPKKFPSHHALTWAQKCFLTPMYIWSVWPSIWGWKVQNIILFRLTHRTNVPKLCSWFGARDLIWVWPAALGNLTLLKLASKLLSSIQGLVVPTNAPSFTRHELSSVHDVAGWDGAFLSYPFNLNLESLCVGSFAWIRLLCTTI